MITKTPQTAVLYGPRIGSVQPEVKSLTAVPQLEAGKIALATVVESRGQNMFMLETAGVRFEVQSDLPLIKGEQIQFQVVKTAPVLELQKVDPGLPAQVRQTLVLAGDIVDVKPLLQILRSSFFSAPQNPDRNPVVSPGNLTTQPAGTAGTPSTAVGTTNTAVGTIGTAGAAANMSQPILQKMEAGAVEQLIRQGNYTVKATILESQGQNKMLVRIGGESYQLQGTLDAAPGTTKVLKLQSLQPVPTFLVVNEGGGVDKSQPLLLNAQKQSLPSLIRALQLPLFTGLDLLQAPQQQLLHSLQSTQPDKLQGPGAGELLKYNLEQLGMRSEALVARGNGDSAATQLKSVLAEISRIFQGQEEVTATASRLLATLESSQFVQASLQQDNGLLFPLLFSFLEKGYLLVDTNKEEESGGGDAEESHSCTLHLTVQGLGNIRVRCVQTKESVRIAFFLDSQEKADFVSTFEGELKEKISSAPLLSLSFTSGAGSPGTTLLQKILPDEQPILNISA